MGWRGGKRRHRLRDSPSTGDLVGGPCLLPSSPSEANTSVTAATASITELLHSPELSLGTLILVKIGYRVKTEWNLKTCTASQLVNTN
jgi:hypothetical protein